MKIPTWALDACLDDETFAAAYESVPAPRRALLKTAIARLYAWHAPEPCSRTRREREWEQGFASLELAVPADACVLLFDAECVSPARLLAGLLPALNAGVREVLAVRVLGPKEAAFPDGLLTAFELAGQERVAGLERDAVRALLAELATTSGSCVVLAFGDTAELVPEGFADGAFRRVWREPAFGLLALMAGGPDDPDLDALAFAHPGTRIVVSGEAEEPSGANVPPEARQDDCPVGITVCHAAESRLEEALGRFPLVFGPGHEACWLHPELGREFFLIRKVAWGGGQNVETEDA